MPQAIVGGAVVVGAVTKPDEVAAMLARELHLPLPGATDKAPADQEIAALREEIARLVKGQEAMQRELQEIRKLLQAPTQGPPPAGAGVQVAVAGRPFKGRKDSDDRSDYRRAAVVRV